ncbi:alpha/beta fold hydrolase [Oceanibium sediminis]|uniref:alpha/beta fold hydrolase n=1 Tax=Oceanibium sediminis TaxID=2026339 RepID=UPI000DD3446C|nr:alpha/beta hydrolase [Oceanibium sediminis]
MSRAAPSPTPARKGGFNWRRSLRRTVERLRLQTVYRDKGVQVLAQKGPGDSAIVVFSSLYGNFPAAQPEMAGTATARGARPAVFVRDLAQGWFQDPATGAALVKHVRAHLDRLGARRVMAVGDSMGGYGALVYAAEIGADTVLAFAPQYDVSPETMPDDPRWKEFRNRIPEFSRGAIDGYLDPKVSYYVLHGREGADIVHWSRFPVGDHLHHYLIRSQTHPISIWLKSINQLSAVFDHALADDRAGFAALMEQLGGHLRDSQDSYLTLPNDWYRTRFPELMRGVDLSNTPHAPHLEGRI